MPESRLTLRPPRRYDLAVALFGHGWIDLAPHGWDPERRKLTTVIALGADDAADVEVRQNKDALAARVTAATRLGREQLEHVRRGLRRMLAVDSDLAPFWRTCRRTPRLSWVERRAAGYLMRSPTLFEDLLKLLFTTNCSWAATRLMCQRTIDALGTEAPSGERAFPDAETCASRDEAFWRDVVRAGYRAKACVALSHAFARGELEDAHFDVTTDELRSLLLSLPGFGPYAAGQAMRLLGHYDELALDSWCRGKIARLRGLDAPPPDAEIEREYDAFGAFRGLALWMDLTADWHDGEHYTLEAY